MEHLTLLHLGCADKYYKGFINIDKCDEWKGKKRKLDVLLDIATPWPYKDESVDGITSMHCLQQLTWRELIKALREAHRVLKKNGVFRFGVPMIESGKAIDYLLGWNNTNLFCVELWTTVLLNHIKFSVVRRCKYGETMLPSLAQIDNRPDQTIYMEAIK